MQAWARQQSPGVQIKSLDNFWQKSCWQGLQKRESALVRQSTGPFNPRHFTISEVGFENHITGREYKHEKVQNQTVTP